MILQEVVEVIESQMTQQTKYVSSVMLLPRLSNLNVTRTSLYNLTRRKQTCDLHKILLIRRKPAAEICACNEAGLRRLRGGGGNQTETFGVCQH